MGSRPRQHTLITLFQQSSHALVDELVERLAAAGYRDIRPAHSRVFENIDADGTRLTELADRARMTHPSMSELVSGLQRLGYVERVAVPDDGRARLVRLTPAGRALQRLALGEIAKIEAAWLARLGPEVGPALAPALVRALDAASADPSPSAPTPPPPPAAPGDARPPAQDQRSKGSSTSSPASRAGSSSGSRPG